MGRFGNHGVYGSLTSNTHKVTLPFFWTFYYCRAAKVMRKRADIDISVGVVVDSAQRTS
jgi:hypothetical protein